MKENHINILNILLFIISFQPIYNTCELEQIATKANECLKETNEDTYCCFIKPLEDSSPSMCYPCPKDKYFGNLKINYNKHIYSIDCGLGSTFMDNDWEMTLEDRQVCGTLHPNKYTDCSDASIDDNTCCYYEGEDMKGCYWLGIKYSGKVSKNKYTFICRSNYIKYFSHLILGFIFFLLF